MQELMKNGTFDIAVSDIKMRAPNIELFSNTLPITEAKYYQMNNLWKVKFIMFIINEFLEQLVSIPDS